MSVAAIRDRDPANRRQRLEQARWLDAQVGRSNHVLLHLLTLGQVAGLIIFLGLLALGLDRLLATPADTSPVPPPGFHWLPAGMLAAAGLRSGMRLLTRNLGRRLARRTIASLRDRILTAGLTPATRLRSGVGTARFTAILTDHLTAASPWFADYLPDRTLARIQPLVILVIAFAIDWVAGLLLLLTAPLIPLFSALIGLGTATLAEEQRLQLDRLGRLFLDRVRNLVTLRLFRRVAAETRGVAEAADGYRRSAMRVLRLAFLSSAVLEFFSAVAIASLAIYIGLALLGYLTIGPADTLGFGEGMYLLLLAPEFFQPLRRLAGGYHERAGAIAAASALRPLANLAPSTTTGSHATSLPRPPRLDVRRLEAAWPGGASVLTDLETQVGPGQWLAVCGPSGCGKSLLAAALLGWVPPIRGRVFLDGRPMDAIDTGACQRTTAWLGQQPHLLPASLRTNLDPGHRHSDRTLYAALDRVALSALPAQLPGGLDAPLGERSTGLSGGEAQRLALARALVGQPRLLILDEPTASLDPENRERILATLESLRGETTLVMMTHDEEAAARADRILRLKNGGRERAD